MRHHLLSLAILVLTFTISGCANSPRTSRAAPRPALINHIVFFELHSPNDAAALIRDCDQLLATIETVHRYYCGTHLDTGRATIRSDYDVSAYIGFQSEADLRAYVQHPQHIELVNRWKPHIKNLRVYDIYDPTP